MGRRKRSSMTKRKRGKPGESSREGREQHTGGDRTKRSSMNESIVDEPGRGSRGSKLSERNAPVLLGGSRFNCLARLG